MSSTPRTPVYFPRMKVRGKRNRAKSAKRVVERTVFPAATLVSNDRYGVVTFTAHAPDSVPVGVTTHRIEHAVWFDGWGRRVPAPAPPPLARIRSDGSFSMSLKMQPGPAADDLWAMLTGKEVGSAPR